MDRPEGMSFEEYKVIRARANKGLKAYQRGKVIWQSDFVTDGMRVRRTYKKANHGKIGRG